MLAGSGLFVLYAALAVAWTWPLAAHLNEAFVTAGGPASALGLADLYLTSWMVSWGAHQLWQDPLRLFDANIYYPLPLALALSENLLAAALLVLPLDVVHHDPILNHNLVVLASFTLAGTGTALLVRDLGGALAASFFAGALFAFGPLRQAQLGHLHALSTHWMPFALLFLHRALRTGGWRPGVAFGVFFLLVAWSSVYHLFFFGLAVGVFLVLYAAWGCPVARGAYGRVFGLLALAGLALLPTVLPYAIARERYALATDSQQVVEFSAVGVQYLGAVLDPRAALGREFHEGILRSPLVGIGALLLALLACWQGAASDRGGRRVAGLYWTLAVALAVVSLGPVVRMYAGTPGGVPGPYAWLERLVPGFDGLRVPQRAAAEALLALAVLAGLGAGVLVGRGRGLVQRGLGALVLAAVLAADCRRPPLHVERTAPSSDVLAVYRWLAAQPGDFALVELPFGHPTHDSLYMMLSTYHWKRLVNGYSATFLAREYPNQVLFNFPDAASIRFMRELHLRYVVVHPPLLSPAQQSICLEPPPELSVRYSDWYACVLEIARLPEPPPAAAERPVPLTGARLSTSSGDDPSAAVDGDVGTHWAQPLDARTAGWLEVDLAEPRPLTRLVVRLGSHFGEYLQSYQVTTSDDGEAWTVVASRVDAEPPFGGLVTNPHDLAVEIPLPGRPVRRLRLVRPVPADPGAFANWARWGVHELELYEAGAPAPR